MKRYACLFASIIMALSPVALAVPVPQSNLPGEATITINDVPTANGGASMALTGEPVNMTATPTGTPLPSGYQYQWQRDEVNLLGATSTQQTLVYSSATAGTWNFRCLVTNRSGTMPSQQVTLTVYWTLAINQNPLWQAALTGGTANFTVGYTGGVGTVSYQWRQDGTNVPGATSSVLTISDTQASDVGNYDCVLTDQYAGGPQVKTSNAAQLVLITSLPTMTLTYNTSTPTTMACSQDSGGTPLQALCPSYGNSWEAANVTTAGIRFFSGSYKNLSGAVAPAPMTASVASGFSLTDASLNGFNGKIIPYVVIGGTRYYLNINLEKVILIKNGVPGDLVLSGDGFYLLNLAP